MMTAESTTIALVAIARPTFDVPLAQSVADTVLASLRDAGHTVVGTANELIMDATGADRVMAALGSTEFDLLVLLQASFADSSMAVRLATLAHERGAPILLWATPDERSGGRLRLNSLCGINLAGHALMLRRIAFDYVLAPVNDSSAIARVEVLARAGRARRTLQSARIGLIGRHPIGFDTCAYDATDLQRLFGTAVVELELDATLAQAAQADSAAKGEFLDRVAAFTPNLAELDAVATAGTAGVYVALREAVDRLQLDAVAVRCWPEFFTTLGCAACGAMSVLNEERCPASCEADINGTVTSLLLQVVSGAQAFITDLVSIDPVTDSGVLWHCGLAPVSMADPEAGVRGAIHSNRKLPLLFEFPLRPGRVTIARLHRTQLDGGVLGYQLAIGGGDMVQAPISYSGTSGVIHFDRPAIEVFDRMMRAGLEHHVSITYGDFCEELRNFARLSGIQVLELTA
ncbi:MAG: fucose isomerase [Anaerolineales bacterium]|nr:fucose isomerase [Anaerolineales bacterium]